MSDLVKDLSWWPWVIVGAVCVSTIADRIIKQYGEDSPKLKKWMRFLIDLLSMLPSKGHPIRGGVQVPMLSYSGPVPVAPAAPDAAPVPEGFDKPVEVKPDDSE